eukprot:UN10740
MLLCHTNFSPPHPFLSKDYVVNLTINQQCDCNFHSSTHTLCAPYYCISTLLPAIFQLLSYYISSYFIIITSICVHVFYDLVSPHL